MNSRLTTENGALGDLHHLAAELARLLSPSAKAASPREAAELAATAWSRLRECGPVYTEGNGFTSVIRALETPGQVECLGWDEVEGATPRLLRDVQGANTWGLWLHLEDARLCPDNLYQDVLKLTERAERPALERAAERWAWAEEDLLAEGLLPVRVLAPPSAVGGARYVQEVLLGQEFVPALRETLAGWGGYIIAHQPDTELPECSWYTLSLESVDDVWGVARHMVHQHYVNLVEEKGGVLA